MNKDELIMNSWSKSVFHQFWRNDFGTLKSLKNELLYLDNEVIFLFPFVSNFLHIVPHLFPHGPKHLHFHYTPLCTLIKLKKKTVLGIFLLPNLKADSLYATITFMRGFFCI